MKWDVSLKHGPTYLANLRSKTFPIRTHPALCLTTSSETYIEKYKSAQSALWLTFCVPIPHLNPKSSLKRLNRSCSCLISYESMDEIKSKEKKTKTNFTQLQYKWHSLLGVSVYTHIWDTFAKNKMVAKENKHNKTSVHEKAPKHICCNYNDNCMKD